MVMLHYQKNIVVMLIFLKEMLVYEIEYGTFYFNFFSMSLSSPIKLSRWELRLLFKATKFLKI